MALNLLGKKNEQVKEYKPVQELYIPPDEPKEKKPSRREVIKSHRQGRGPAESGKKVEEDITRGVDLADEILKKKKRMRMLITAIAVLLAGGAGVGIYYLSFNQSKLAQPVTTPAPLVAPPVTSPVAPSEQPAPSQPSALPNTPLAPLRGSLVKFAAGADVYLVEENGELRIVNQNTAVFDNGQSYTQINKNLIYELPDKWKDTRRGAQEVTGQVDFDPRILSLAELLPFTR